MAEAGDSREQTPVEKRPWCVCPRRHFWLGWPKVVNVCTTCSEAASHEFATPSELDAWVTANDADRLYLDLKGARERLCRAQVHVPTRWRSDLQIAMDAVDDVGSSVCPDQWSAHDQPEYGEAKS